LCFLDCYSGYHQIALKVSDQDKTVFIMPHDIYCYTTMNFGLKNARATYQKAIQKCLESQIGKTVEAYVDDVVVKMLTDKTRIHLRSASVRTYTFFTTGFPRYLSIRRARGLLALNQVLI
jgi:hypothetical protein